MKNIFKKLDLKNYSDSFKTAKSNFLLLKQQKKRVALTILLVWVLLVSLIAYLSIANISNIWQAKNSVQQESDFTDNVNLNIPEDPILENSGSENFFLKQMQDSLQSTSGVFDNFIAYTPDPTGRSNCYKGESLVCELSFIPQSMINFPATEINMPSTQKIINTLLSLVVPFAFILISIQGFNFLVGENTAELKSFLFRVIGGIVMLILTPYILSISIMLINQLSNFLLGNGNLTEFIVKFIDSLENESPDNSFFDLFKSFLELGNIGGINPLSYLAAIPVIIAMGLVGLLLYYICFQFILRFLNLYFLSAVYPFTIVFSFHPKTTQIVTNYWKQWTTFMIQQPVFILGFIIIREVLVSIFDKGLSLEVMIIFIGLLIFLSTIHIFASRLWGDIYTAVANNVSAGIAANLVKTSFIDKPLEYAGRLASVRSEQNLAGISKKYLNTDSAPNEEAKEASPAKNAEKSIYQSQLNKELRGGGLSVNELPNGKLSASGNFYSDSKNNSPIQKLYISPDDAVRDGVNAKNIQSQRLSNLVLQDTSNTKSIGSYNGGIKDYAGENSGHAKNISLNYKSPDSKVKENMAMARSYNYLKGVQAVGVKNDGVGGDKSILGDNIIKIHAYKDVIKNKNAGY